MNTTTATQQIAALEVCTDWLMANACLDDLRWRDDSGRIVTMRPSDELFIGADEATYAAWEAMNYQEQCCCMLTAADELAWREQLTAGAI
jgi:hypothetical protein